MTLVRVISTLSPELEDLVHRTIGAFLTVHRELGSGMSEGIYSAAAQIELLTHGIPFEHERTSCSSCLSCLRDESSSSVGGQPGLLFVRLFDALPRSLELLECHVGHGAFRSGDVTLHRLEPARKLLVRFAQRRFGLDAELA